MKIFDTYSKRQKGLPDVYVYAPINIKLRNQIFHIWNDFISQSCFKDSFRGLFRRHVYETLLREEGKKILYSGSMYTNEDPAYQVEKYFEELSETEKILDVIEITFFSIERIEKVVLAKHYVDIPYSASSAIQDLNRRFKENGIGYEFSNELIIRIDNELMHQETIQTTLALINNPIYKHANEEFLKAHEHYRHGRNQESLNDCLKSLESTMKIICKRNDWLFNETDTAKSLINTLIINSFLPKYNESSLNALKQLLEGSIPTVRNKNSGHGQGTIKITVPDNLASYMLFMTGATIRFFVETQNSIDKMPLV